MQIEINWLIDWLIDLRSRAPTAHHILIQNVQIWCLIVQSAYLKIWLNLKQIATEFICMVSCTLIISK